MAMSERNDALVAWLVSRGYQLRENGPMNPMTGRGWYSHPCEYQRAHVRVRINRGGIIVLRDPGCTIQITRPTDHGMSEFVTPNAQRIDYPYALGDTVAVMERAIEGFESRPAFTADEARSHFFGEVAA